MDDYISREAFKGKYLCCGYLPEMQEKEFDEFPAADVEPVRHGRWGKAQDMRRMDGNIYDYRCSLCDSLAEKGVYNNYDKLTNYCPNCGAKMGIDRGGKNASKEM